MARRKRRGVRGRKATGRRTMIVSPLSTEMIRSEGRNATKRKH